MQDFVCERCGVRTAGVHCSKCLWSKHVDVTPGDRNAVCRGLMKPISIEENGDEYSIIYHCRTCDKTIKNKIAPEDDIEAIAALGGKMAKWHR